MKKIAKNVKTVLLSDTSLSEVILHVTSVYTLVTTYSIVFFLKNGKTDYMRYTDYVYNPMMAIIVFFILFRIVLFYFKDQKFNLKNIVNKQLFLLFIYILFYLSKISIEKIFLYHMILAITLLTDDILKKYFSDSQKIRKILFYSLLFISIIFLSLYNNTWANNKYNIFTRYKSPLDSPKKVRLLVIDSYCENAAYNAAKYYNDESFTKFYFLPVIDYPHAPSHIIPDIKAEFLYTHINGIWPIINLGILYKLVGEDKSLTYNKYRFYPFIWFLIGFIALVFFFKEISNNNLLALMFALLVVLQPAVNLIKLSVYTHSYAFSFFFIELFATVKYFRQRSNKYLYLLFFCGVIQGGITIDFYLHVLMAPLMTMLIPNQIKNYNRNCFYPFFSVLCGIILTLIVMLIINSLYFGSLYNAVIDFKNTAKWRSVIIWSGLKSSQYYIYNLLKNYSIIASGPRFFQYPIVGLYALMTLIFAFLSLGNFTIVFKNIVFPVLFVKKITLFLIVAFIVSFFWIVIMKNHSAIHATYIARYLILLFIAKMSVLSVLINNKNWQPI